MPNYLQYQKSISQELISEKDRVRNFIDDRHWGEDGKYKEVILTDCIRQKLPQNVRTGTGFVIGSNNTVTSQIDIIIFRSDIPPLFQKNDFVILTKEAVLGIIEVKTRLDRNNIDNAFRRCHENGEIIGTHIFNGIFGYESDFQLESALPRRVSDDCVQYAGYINNISFGENYFMKYWTNGRPNNESGKKYKIYEIEGLSFGYFISNLVEDVVIQTTGASISNELNEMFYPIENTKEAHIKYTIPINAEEN